MTASPEEVRHKWRRHFSRILNTPSEYQQVVIDGLPGHSPRLELDGPPTMEELLVALKESKKGKASGKTRILPELLLYGGVELHDRLLQVMQDVWEQGAAVEDWKDAVIVPIPKKGNLKECDNWRGINLLDVVGKLLRVSYRRGYRW